MSDINILSVKFNLKNLIAKIRHMEDEKSFHEEKIKEYQKDEDWLGSCFHCSKWLCPTAPKLVCGYTHSMDSCDYCHDPEERK